MSPTLERLRKLKKEPPIKPKQVRPRTGNFPRLIINLPPDVILVLIGLLLLRSRLCFIFIPPQDVTPQDLKTSVLDVVNVDIGPIAAPEAQVLLTQELLENEQYPFEFEEFSHSSFVQGKLRSCIDFWRSINCSDFILDVIDNGYKILFENAPTSFSFKNRGSTNQHSDFVNQSILELLDLGCIKEFSNPPEFCNPWQVAVQSSGKLRLILDLSHLNTMLKVFQVRRPKNRSSRFRSSRLSPLVLFITLHLHSFFH